MTRTTLAGATLAFALTLPGAALAAPGDVVFTFTKTWPVGEFCGETDNYVRFKEGGATVGRTAKMDTRDCTLGLNCQGACAPSAMTCASPSIPATPSVRTWTMELLDEADGICAEGRLDFVPGAPETIQVELDFVDGKVRHSQSVVEQDGEFCVTKGANFSGGPGVCWTVAIEPAADTDGDGIPDVWEQNGIDRDGDGTIDLNLTGTTQGGVAPIDPTLAADPNVRDVYVELDWWDCAQGGCATGDTRNWQPANGPLQDVVQAFARNGVNLHLINSQALPLPTGTMQDANGNYPYADAQLDVDYRNNLGNAGDSAQTLALKRRFFRYSIWADVRPNGSSGLGGGGRFLVTLGVPGTAPTGFRRSQLGGTFMHELGHTLGLGHGGLDGVNYKPNHFSVMSYTFQFNGLDRTDTMGNDRILDYSAVASSLDETALNETSPVVSPASYTMTWICPNGSMSHRLIGESAQLGLCGNGDANLVHPRPEQ